MRQDFTAGSLYFQQRFRTASAPGVLQGRADPARTWSTRDTHLRPFGVISASTLSIFAVVMSDHEPSHGSHAVIDFDQLVEIFAKTVGSIKGAAGLLLWCTSTVGNPNAEAGQQPPIVWVAAAWILLVVVVRACMWLNRRILRGRGPWSLDPAKDVILITGGARGLGLVLSALFSMDGYRIVVLDIEKPDISIAHSTYLRVDVGDEQAVSAAIADLAEPPAVLINCAGTVTGTLGPTHAIDASSISNVVNTNLLGSIWTARAALIRNPALKMIVGISSSTAFVGPARAGVYAASKAGVRIFMESLRHELPSTRVLCVTPGQLDTSMFKDIKTPSKFWAPVLNTPDVAEHIYKAICNGEQGELKMPTYSIVLPFILLLPRSLVDALRWWNGLDRAVDLL